VVVAAVVVVAVVVAVVVVVIVVMLVMVVVAWVGHCKNCIICEGHYFEKKQCPGLRNPQTVCNVSSLFTSLIPLIDYSLQYNRHILLRPRIYL
jgi:hypothetical protein